MKGPEMIRQALWMAFTAMISVSMAMPAAAGLRKDIDHVGMYNFVVEGTLVIEAESSEIIDPTYFPEGPIGFPEGPIGRTLVAVIDGTFVAES